MRNVERTFKHSRKIDPYRSKLSLPDGSPSDNDKVERSPTPLAFQEWEARGLTPPSLEQMRSYRLSRVREQLRVRDYAGILLWDPVNIRYATDSSNMNVWIAHNQARACFIATEGAVIIFDFPNCKHLSSHLSLIDEVRNVTAFYYWEVGSRVGEFATNFATEISGIMERYAGQNRRLAVDKMELEGIRKFDTLGIEIKNGQEVMELARSVKDQNEINAIRCAIASTEIAMEKMHETLRPGITESELWAVLHAENIRRGGEWIETRMLSSGPRTNPWFQECGARVIREGDLVAFDTDLIGPYGYCADISRTWLCGDKSPSGEQKSLYQIALEKINHNIEILRPGMTFREVSEKGFMLPEKFLEQRYSGTHHGVGMCDEYPLILYHTDFEAYGYDGLIEAGMILSVEAYIGEVGGEQGVKLEDQILVTEYGVENLTAYGFEERLYR